MSINYNIQGKLRSSSNANMALKLILITLLINFLSCASDKETRGYQYGGDMAKSTAYETYSSSKVYKDGKSALRPVVGTIPREMVPYTFENNNKGLKKAGLELKNPLEATTENIEQGKELFIIYCINCHGENGDGNGFLFTSEKFPIKPASLIDEKTVNRPDGEIFHVITVGGAAMGSHASQIKPVDRWKIILYIRTGFDKNI
ncbi:MAG: cytochrome C [Bacteroidetes bacterium]|nr:cytochrome C [Bacteroidota bacterium]|tara:strand:- start:4513 stop:5121 length:609 start_codon:yes stop_codon:yes gene_type:complete